MNNTIYESMWLVTWEDQGVRYNETCDWRGMADDLYLEKKLEFGRATLDELVPEGVKTLDMNVYDWGDDDASWCGDMGDLIDDGCDWCGHTMPSNEGGHCCTDCFMKLETRGGMC